MSWTGRVRLGFTRRGERSVATEQYCHGALKVMRPTHPHGSPVPYWTLMNPGGGYVDGDRYAIELNLGRSTEVVVDSQAATKVYRCAHGEVRQRAEVRLSEDSVLALRPHPLIAYRDARYVQETFVTMHPSARLCSREVVTSGWSPDGQRFGFSAVRMRLRVQHPDGRLVLVDNLVLEPDALDPRGPTVLAGHSHLGTLAMVGSGLPDISRVRKACAAANRTAACRVGVGGAAGSSVVVRCLGSCTDEVEQLLRVAERLCAAA